MCSCQSIYGNNLFYVLIKLVNEIMRINHNYIGSVNYQTLEETLNFTGSDWRYQPVLIYKK